MAKQRLSGAGDSRPSGDTCLVKALYSVMDVHLEPDHAIHDRFAEAVESLGGTPPQWSY